MSPLVDSKLGGVAQTIAPEAGEMVSAGRAHARGKVRGFTRRAGGPHRHGHSTAVTTRGAQLFAVAGACRRCAARKASSSLQSDSIA